MFSGSMTALVTPFKGASKEIDFSLFASLVQRQVENQTSAIVIAGTTGEGPTLSDDEINQLTDVAILSSNRKIPVIVTTGTNDTEKSLKRTKEAKNRKAAATLVIVPYYNKPCFRGIKKHFEKIAEAGLPIIVYNHPGRTGISLTAEELVEITKIDEVVGIKEASDDPDLTKKILKIDPDVFIFTGNDDLALDVIKNGGKGSISVISNLLPLQWSQFIQTCIEGRFVEAQEEYQQIEPLIKAIFREINPQGIKCALSLAGLCENQLRLPMVEALKENEEAIFSQLRQRKEWLQASLLTTH